MYSLVLQHFSRVITAKVQIYGFLVSNELKDFWYFFQVSKYFSEIFKKLAPEGHAVLVMKKGDQDQGVGRSVEHSTLHRSFILLS